MLNLEDWNRILFYLMGFYFLFIIVTYCLAGKYESDHDPDQFRKNLEIERKIRLFKDKHKWD